MRILYVATRYVYRHPEAGASFEHYSFYDTLARGGHEIIYFDFPTLEAQYGRVAMNRRLVDAVAMYRPELVFLSLIQDEISPETLRAIRRMRDIPVANWFCDDHFRFERFTKHYAPACTHAITTDATAIPQYRRIGMRHVILTQWACNPTIFRPIERQPIDAVTFVGQTYSHRKAIVESIASAGLPIQTWGTGWGRRIGLDEMVGVYANSAISLNFSEAAAVAIGPHRSLPQRVILKLMRTLGVIPPFEAPALPRQIKGRVFEICGCGGFLLTQSAPGLEGYYHANEEIAIADNTAEIIERARYYMAHPTLREQMRARARARTLLEHTYDQRFADIFRQLGVSTLDSGSVPPNQPENRTVYVK